MRGGWLDLYPTAEGIEAIDRHGGIPTHWQVCSK